MASEEHCVKALDQHEEKLSKNPQVQGMGIVAPEGKPFDSEDCAVAVYVVKKVPKEELPEEHHLPETLEIEHGGARHEVPVRVIEQGPVTLEQPGMESADAVPGLEAPVAVPGPEAAGAESVGTEPGLEAADDSEE